MKELLAVILETTPRPEVVREMHRRACREADCLKHLIRVAERIHPPLCPSDPDALDHVRPGCTATAPCDRHATDDLALTRWMAKRSGNS